MGFGIADIATLTALAHRAGNWFVAAIGDAELLGESGLDELDILKRGGSVDMARFNKRWGQRLRTLLDNQPQIIDGSEAEEALGELTHFTAYMTCIVAVLDELSSEQVTRQTVRLLLKALLRPTERGEDFIASQINNRLNSWRSNAKIRGLALECRKIRLELIDDQILLNGSMSGGEANKMAEALHWLLAENTNRYVTNSSDIIGAMICLERLGFDVISVEGPGLDPDPPERSCRVVYSPYAISGSENEKHRRLTASILVREPSTVVSLNKPHESLTKFPIDGITAERCRQAWKAGADAAKSLEIELEIPDPRRIKNAHDLHYRIIDHGTEPVRSDEGIFQLAFAHALAVNQEICQRLQTVLNEPEEILNWIHGQTTDPMSSSPHVSHRTKLEKKKIDAFNVFQAFFMGYYYEVFLSLVDTTTLEIQTVDGSWGYCSAELLKSMRKLCRDRAEKGFSRQELIQILARLLFSHKSNVQNHPAREQWCVGVVSKRTLLAQSLLGICKTPRDIGRFVLLDVDVGGIPTVRGLIMPGHAPSFVSRGGLTKADHPKQFLERGPDVDFTSHIEADWDGNPENMLLCFRYKGRRIGSVNPCVADLLFCHAYVNPVERCTEGPQRSSIPVVECDLSDFQQGRVIHANPAGVADAITLVQVYGRPLMRYAAVAFYGITYTSDIRISSNCLDTAIRHLRETKKTTGIIIAGEGPWQEPRPLRLELRKRLVN